MGTGLNTLVLLLGVLLLVVDSLSYYPLFKTYDVSMLAQEERKGELEGKDNKKSVVSPAEPKFNESEIPLGKTKDQQALNVLVLCAGDETSGILARSLNKLAKKDKLPLDATVAAFGPHHDLIPGMDVIISAPQMDTAKDEPTKECKQNDARMITITGKQYIYMTQHANECSKLLINDINKWWR